MYGTHLAPVGPASGGCAGCSDIPQVHWWGSLNPPDPAVQVWVTQQMSADVDGDGRSDDVSFTAWSDGRSRLSAETAKGVVNRDFSGGEVSGLVSSYDVDGDGAAELFVDLGGNTLSNAGIVPAADSGWQWIATPSTDGPDGRYLAYTPHSNCCPLATLGVVCTTVGGKRALVVSESELVNDAGTGLTFEDKLNTTTFDKFRRAWATRTYELRGTELVLVAHDNGIVGPGESAPGLGSANKLDCGKQLARW